MSQAEVAVVRCRGYDDAPAVARSAAECLDLAGGARALFRRGDRVLLKPNLLSVMPAESGVNTHPAAVRAVAETALAVGARVCIGDSPAFARLEDVCDACGVGDVARELGIPIRPFCRPAWVPCRLAEAPFRGFFVDREVLDADVVVNLPKLKAHRQAGFTGAIKNLYGCMPGKRKAFYHARMHGDRRFAAFVAAFAATVAPAITLVDAVVVMHRTGPKGGDLLPMGLLFAGRDPFAVDAVIAQVIGAPESHNMLVTAGRQMGIGTTDLSAIRVRGADPLPAVEFRHPMLVGTSFSLPRVARSAWRSFLIAHLGFPEH